MKKFICLALSIMMVMSMLAVPVMAEDEMPEDVLEETTPTIVTPATASVEPTMWIKAATVEKFMENKGTENKIFYCNPNWTENENGDYTRVGNYVYKRFNGFNTYESDYAPSAPAVYDNMNTSVPASMGLIMASVYDATKTGAEGLTPWEGFRFKADDPLTAGSGGIRAYTGTGGYTLNNTAKGTFDNKDIRVDSARFKMDAYDEDSVVSVFGTANSASLNTPPYAVANSSNAMRIINGGASVVNLANGSSAYANFLEPGTLKADIWYRIERILDVRNDDGTTGEVWQRFIIYDDATNEIIGDTKWIKTMDATMGTYTFPYKTTGISAGKFPEGAHIYVDDIKAWAINTPSDDYVVGAPEDPGDKWLTFPADNATNVWARNHAVIQRAYVGSDITDPKYQETVTNSKYIYFKEDFMIPEDVTNNYGFGLIDIYGNPTYTNVDGGDPTDLGSYTGGYTNCNGIIQVKKDANGNSVLKVRQWDVTTEKTKNDKTYTGYYIGDVPFKDGTSSLTLTKGEWYTATFKVDQSMYAGRLTHFPAKDANEYKAALIGDDGELTLMTKTQTTKASVIITDSHGNTYETDEFVWRSPQYYMRASSLGALILIDGRRPNSSTTKPKDYKVSIDNVKIVLSDSTIDAEDAYVIYEEEFDNQVTGNNFTQVGKADKWTDSASEFAIVEVNRDTVVGVPSQIQFTAENALDATKLASSIKLYKGEVNVSDQIEAINYDAEAKTVIVSLKPLEPVSDYSLTIDRKAAEVEANIFSIIPSTDAYTFSTGYADTGELVFNPVFTAYGISVEDSMFATGYYDGMEITGSTSSLVSNNANKMNYLAIAAIYDGDGRMEDMMSEIGEIDGNGATKNIFTAAEDTLIATSATKTIKAFIWNTWRLMKPIANQYSYSLPTAQ